MNPKTPQDVKKPQSFYRATACLLCGARDLELALPLAPSAIGNDYFPSREQAQECYSLSLYLCHACGNVQVEDVVDTSFVEQAVKELGTYRRR